MKLILLAFLLTSSFAYAQPPIEWEKTYGGSSSEDGFAIAPASDGGYFCTGGSSSSDGDVISGAGPADFWIFKIDAEGALIWEIATGGSGIEFSLDVEATDDGGCIVIGHTNSTGGDISVTYGGTDMWVVKINSLGAIEWEKSFGGSNSDVGRSIKQTNDGGYILGGYTSSADVEGHINSLDCWVVKLAPDGSTEWQGVYGGSNSEEILTIEQTSDNGYVFTGFTSSSDGDISALIGGVDCWIVKLSELGEIEWERTYGGMYGDFGYYIEQTSDNGYIVASTWQYLVGTIDTRILKIDPLGEIEWENTLGGSGSEIMYSVHQTASNGYILAGYTDSNDGDISSFHGGYVDSWVIKLTPDGVLDWEKTLGGTSNEYGREAIQADDNGYMIIGYTESSDGDVSENKGLTDIWVVKLDADETVDTTDIVVIDDPIPGDTLLAVSNKLIIPNVFTPNGDGANDIYQLIVENQNEVELVIVNRWGTIVYQENDLNPIWDGSFNGKNCADGVYFIKYYITFENGEELNGHSAIELLR